MIDQELNKEVNVDIKTVNQNVMKEELKREVAQTKIEVQTEEERREALIEELDNLFDEIRISVGDREYLLEWGIIEVIKGYTDVSTEEALRMIKKNLYHEGVLCNRWRVGGPLTRAVYSTLDRSVGFEDYSYVELWDDGYTEEQYNAIVDNELSCYYDGKGILIALSYDGKNIEMVDNVYSPRHIMYLIEQIVG